MATKRTMVFYGNTKKANNGDTNEPGKKPKTQPKPKLPTVGKGTVDPANTDRLLQNANKNVGRPHPVTGKPMTKSDAIKAEREKEYRKNAGYKNS